MGQMSGKTCNLVFAFPPLFDPRYPSPYTLTSPGGILVSRLSTSGTVSQTIGNVTVILPGNKYLLESAPCSAEQQSRYRMDSVGGLDLSFFQTSLQAPLGLFYEVS